MRIPYLLIILLVVAAGCTEPEPPSPRDNEAPPAAAGEQLGDMSIEDYDPVSTLVVEENPVTAAKFPFVDVHSHWFRAPDMSEGALDTLIAEMDDMNAAVLVNLSGGSGERLQESIETMEGYAPSRFVTFANVDFDGVGEEGWAEQAVARLREDVESGARGLKIYKNLGMTQNDVNGERIPVDDPRLEPIWDLCGELGIPVLIHSADPRMFWQPRDAQNEKWLELKLRPQRYRAPGEFPPFEDIIAEQHRMFEKHPETTFINAHLGWMGNDLEALGDLLDRLPNVYTEIGAVIYELGRQPRTGARFMTEYRDRVLFGKDAYNRDEFDTYFRVLETEDEYFDYYRKYHAHWQMYGLGLSDDVLRHVYYLNALRIIPGLDRSLFPEA